MPPLVSILTPTYGRGEFVRLLAQMIAQQTVPLRQMEWIVLDDSPTPTAAWLRTHPLGKQLDRLQYVYTPDRRPIGAKRNATIELARGTYCVQMDDDDCYGARYVETVLREFESAPTARVVGSSIIHLLYPNEPCLWQVGPFGANHSGAATLSFRRVSYGLTHRYNDADAKAEERSFLNGYREPMRQIRGIEAVYFTLVHATNTVSKDRVRRWPTHVPWQLAVPCVDALMHYHCLSRRPSRPLFAVPPSAQAKQARAAVVALLRCVHLVTSVLLTSSPILSSSCSGR